MFKPRMIMGGGGIIKDAGVLMDTMIDHTTTTTGEILGTRRKETEVMRTTGEETPTNPIITLEYDLK